MPRMKLLATAPLLVALGCGSDPPDPTTAIAIGVATIDGAPITGGMITIAAEEKSRRRANGMLRTDGTFRVEGAPIGPCRVTIDTTSLQVGDPSNYTPLPIRYEAFETTGLRVDLAPGENREVELRCGT